jgi:hypothetical protein
LLLSSWYPPERVTIGGVPLEPLPIGGGCGFELGELEPDSSYEVLIEPDTQSGEATPSTLSFTTGSTSLEPNPGAAPGPVDLSWHDSDDSSGLCLAALSTQDCFDTGQDTYFHFTPTTGSALGWLLVRDGFDSLLVHVWRASAERRDCSCRRQRLPV